MSRSKQNQTESTKRVERVMETCHSPPGSTRGGQSVGVFILLWWLGCVGVNSSAASASSVGGDPLFDSPEVLNLGISISSQNIESLKTEPRRAVSATVTENGKTYTNVVLHLKGLGSFRPITEKPSFSIRFDRHGACLRGHSRILLENSTQDAAFLRRKLTSEIFLKAGIPAARVTHATVQLNGRKLGLYTLSEAMNRAFLARHFRSNSGNLYEGSDEDISGHLEQDAGANSGDPGGIQTLIAACQEPNLTRRWDLLQSRLDMDRFLSFMALEVLICHHDGYSMDLNNYRLYDDPTTGRVVFIPHGMDLVFNRPSIPLEPAWKGLVAQAVMETPQGKERYRARIAQLARSTYGGGGLLQRIDDLASFLRPVLLAQSSSEREEFENAIATLKASIQRRADFVFSQVTVPSQ